MWQATRTRCVPGRSPGTTGTVTQTSSGPSCSTPQPPARRTVHRWPSRRRSSGEPQRPRSRNLQFFALDGGPDAAWPVVLDAVNQLFPSLPVVGYEQGDDLVVAIRHGLAAVGKLRIWLHGS